MTSQRAGQVLGANLRERREALGISLSELARRSGIAKGTLSQLESGAGNPTIETVFSLSNALDVPVSTLLTEPVDPDVVVVRSADLEVLSGEAVDLRLLRRIEHGGAVLEVYDQRVRAGCVQESTGHPGIEHTAVVSGTLQVSLHGRAHRIGPGDYVSFRAGTPHSYTAVDGEVRSVLLLEHPVEQVHVDGGGSGA